jgi:hypothetical protein
MAQPRDLSHLFSSNAVPEPGEESFVKLNIENLLGKISEVQQLEEDLLIQISQARAQLQALKDDLRQYQRVVSSIRRMPAEILGEIFKLSPPSPTMCVQGRSWIVTLCLVCKDWCLAARLTRPLWSSARIDADSRGISFDKAAAWLGRAGVTPRSITYRAGEIERLPDPQFAKLLAQGPHLDHLSLVLNSPLCFTRLLHSLESFKAGAEMPRSWDLIRSMAVNFTFSGWARDGRRSEQPPTIFHGIPSSVTSFRLQISSQRPPQRFVHPIRHLPTEFLERLNSFSVTYPIPYALQHCVNVESLAIDFNRAASEWIGDSLTPRSPRSVVHFPHLHTLCLLYATDSNPTKKVIQSLRTPSLTTLKIYNGAVELCREISRLYQPSVSKLPQVEACPVRHLILDKTSCTTHMLRSALLGFPLLTRLTLQSSHLHALDSFGILDYLLDTTLAPRLVILELLDLEPPTYIDLLPLIKVIEVRSQPESSSQGEAALRHSPGCLRKVIVTYSPTNRGHPPPNNALVQEIRKLARSRGVFISVDSELLC